MTGYSRFVVPRLTVRRHAPAKLDWLSAGVLIADRLGTPEKTTIVHSRKFTSAILAIVA